MKVPTGPCKPRTGTPSAPATPSEKGAVGVNVINVLTATNLCSSEIVYLHRVRIQRYVDT